MKKINYICNEINVYLFLFLIVNPIISLITNFFPQFLEIIPNNFIFLLRFIILSIPIIKGINHLNLYSFSFLFILALLLIISSINRDNLIIIKHMFMNGEEILLILQFIFISEIKDIKAIFNTFTYLSYIIVTILIVLALTGYYGEYAQFRYMEFSHSIILYWTFIIQDAYANKKNNIFYLFYLFIVTLLIALLSNRAILINIFVCLVLFFNLYIHNNQLRKRINYILFCFTTVIVVFFNYIKNLLLHILSLFNINSYSLITLELGSFFTSSSRKEIWIRCINSISNHLIIGTGIGSDRVINANVGLYAHNFLLELWVDFGIIVGSFLCFFYFKNVFSFFKKASTLWRKLFLPFFINALLILTFSKSIYILPEFWMSIAILCAYFHTNKEVLK